MFITQLFIIDSFWKRTCRISLFFSWFLYSFSLSLLHTDFPKIIFLSHFSYPNLNQFKNNSGITLLLLFIPFDDVRPEVYLALQSPGLSAPDKNQIILQPAEVTQEQWRCQIVTTACQAHQGGGQKQTLGGALDGENRQHFALHQWYLLFLT